LALRAQAGLGDRRVVWARVRLSDDALRPLRPERRAVGGNLSLLALDIAWDRQAHDRFAETAAKETLDASPSTS
jgi:hypothetical protein